jgi:FKBP-type peptidyl-prolyl cis-trans isomerase SlyD
MLPIKECMMVTIEYRLWTISRDGERTEAGPFTCDFVYGVEAQYPSVESALQNKTPGERVEVLVPPEELFGVYDQELVREFPRGDFKEERLQVGRVYREMRKKSLVQFLVRDLRDDIVVADFNDARAGAHAEFDILIKDVRPASKGEMKPSCLPRPQLQTGG